MVFRKAKPEDVPEMLEIVSSAVAYLKSCGVNQWQDGYPNEEILRSDIEKGVSYVIEDDGAVAATVAVTFEPEKVYGDIEGKWLNDEPYGVVHRSAVSNKFRGKGYGKMLFAEAERLCLERGIRNVRVDTHRDNMTMQAVLKSRGFKYCGTVVVETAENDKLRDAFHKVLK